MVRYAILGPVELCHGKRRVAVGDSRQVALLALLLLNANRVLPGERLIEALWSDLGPASAIERLQVTLAGLRRTLGLDGRQGEDVLRTVEGGYLLTVAPGELDADTFQARVEEGRRAFEAGDAAYARDVLRASLGLWRGPMLAEVASEEFAQPEIRRFEELRLAAFEALVDCELQLGEHDGVIEPGPELRALHAEALSHSPAPQRVSPPPGSAARAADQAAVLPTGVVTFMLTDVEGSTPLWEADADAMAAGLEFHDGLIAGLVEQHGGRLLKDQGEGDSTLSVFENASDAVVCAAALQRAMETASRTAELALRLRVALHSGEAQERDGDYFGPVLNRAARLRSLAAGGVTVLSQGTAELVRDRLAPDLALVDVGRHELRGLSRPERVFELRATAGASAAASVAAGPILLPLARALDAPDSCQFVGRDAELEHLRERWTAVCAGAFSAVVIGGEAGIGKTRLAREVARTVHEQGALVLYGRCDEGLAVPYQPFVEALRPYARAAGLDRLRAELGHLAPELGRLLPELAALGDPVRADPESERFALFEAVAALIEAATREQRALIVLDDLHWAATPTLLMLRHLVRSERSLAVLLLGTYRETELDPGQPLAQLLADLYRDSSVDRLSIGGLDERAIAELLQATSGRAPDERASQLVRVLGTQTAGNPFFICELLAHLTESGMLSAGGERSRGVTAADLEVPEGLRRVIAQRVARVSAPARRALSVAAVAGPTFSFVLLEHVLGEGSGVLDALEEARAGGLLTEAGHGDYAFAHALVRQAIYGQLGSARQMRLHRELGEALESLGYARARVEELAHHFAQAAADGQGVKAATYALAAGRSAIARLGYEDAAAHYERGLRALALTGQPQAEQHCELLLALGEARLGAGELDKAREACAQAAELAEKRGDATALARAALGFCGPHRLATAGTRSVAALLDRALAALADDDSTLRAQVMGRLAAFSACAQRKPVLAREALQMARRVADKATLADVLFSTLWATRGPGALHESLVMAAELGGLADEVGDRRLRALAHGWVLDHLLELGDMQAVEREFEALQRLAEARKERYFKWILMARRANRAHLAGQLEQCEELARDALAHRFEGYDEAAALLFGLQMMFVRREQGRLDELVQTFEGFAEQDPKLASCARAYVYAQLGWPAHARQALEAVARADFGDIARDTFWLSNLSGLCEVVVFLGDAPRAQLLYDLLLPYADRCVVIFALLSQGSASRPLGLLATMLSRFEDATRHFEQALSMNAQIRSPLWTAHTQHDYARMLLARGQPGDHDEARALLREALAAAQELGLETLADKARLLKLRTRAAESPRALPRRL